MARLDHYRSRGARALVLLHERRLREFLATWRRFKAAGAALPATSDPSYASPEALLRHVLRWAGSYMVWMCEVLGLPDPGIEPVPGEAVIEAEAESYLEHVVARWRTPLAEVLEEEALWRRTYPSPWGADYSVDAMLEHAVMHPVRHGFQLRELMGEDAS